MADTTTVVCTQISGQDEDGCEWWVRISEDGHVVAHSRYGTWFKRFDSGRKKTTIAAFLAAAGESYMCMKLHGGAFVDDLAGTVEHARYTILRLRRAKELDAESAREEWELVDDLENGDNNYTISAWLSHTCLDDAWEICSCILDPAWTSFWREIWLPHVLPALKELIPNVIVGDPVWRWATDTKAVAPCGECGGAWRLEKYGLSWHLWHSAKDVEVRVDSFSTSKSTAWASKIIEDHPVADMAHAAIAAAASCLHSEVSDG